MKLTIFQILLIVGLAWIPLSYVVKKNTSPKSVPDFYIQEIRHEIKWGEYDRHKISQFKDMIEWKKVKKYL